MVESSSSNIHKIAAWDNYGNSENRIILVCIRFSFSSSAF